MSDSSDSGRADVDGLRGDAEELLDPITDIAKAVWWLVLIRGIFAVLFGIVALIAPGAALVGIVFVFAAYAIVDGIFQIVHGLRVRGRRRGWGWLLAQGIVSVLAGVAAAAFPGLAGTVGALFVLWTIVVLAIVNGIAGIPAATALADAARRALALVIAILSILVGVLLAILIFVQPVIETVLGLIWVVGIWAIVAGVMLIVLAIQARVAARRLLS